MPGKNFFDEPTEPVVEPTETVEEVTKIKLGEDEYTQEELQRLVGLGKIGDEAEQKYKIKIEGVWPNLQRTINEKKDLERQIEELKTKPQTSTVQQESAILTEDLKRKALEQAEALGIGPRAMEGVMRQVVRDEIAARDLINDVSSVISSAESDGKPTTTVDRILQHMQETGIKNPDKAYKDLFETELDKWKEAKLSTLRPSSMTTTQQSTAGGKYPAQPRPPKNRDELIRAVGDMLNNTEA